MKKLLPALWMALFAVLPFTPSAQALDPAKPGAGEITNLRQTIDTLPHEVLTGLRGNEGKEAAAAKATEALRDKIQGRLATLRFRIDRIEDDLRADNKGGYRIKAENTHLRNGSIDFTTLLWVHCNQAGNARIAALKRGNEITMIGKISLAAINAQGILQLHIELSEAALK